MDNGPIATTIKKTKNKFKIISIVFIVLAALLAVATVSFVALYFDQKGEVNRLSQEVESISADFDSYKTEQEAKNNIDISATEADEDLATTLAKVYEIAGHDISELKIGEIEDINEISNSLGQVASPAPYQIVRVSMGSESEVGGFSSFFYRNGPEGVWKYGFSGQGIPYCQVFEFSESSKVFAGFDCYDLLNDLNTTVGEWYGH